MYIALSLASLSGEAGREPFHARAPQRVRLRPPRLLRLLPVVLVGLMVGGCSPAGTGPGHRAQALALSPAEELELGREASRQLLSQVHVIRQGADAERVRRVGERIARVVAIEPLLREINLDLTGYQFEWEYNLIESEQVNAFCLPGGKIGVFTGMLRVVENDDQLAAVVAHEVAHALAHHVSERIAYESQGANGLWNLHFDREQEAEADHIGVFFMTFAGYDPKQALVFWQRMAELGRQNLHLPEILSDHPSDRRRIENLEGWVPLALAAKRAYDEGRVEP